MPLFFFFFLLSRRTNLETWKVEEIKANDYSRDEKFSSTGWKRKYRSCVVHQPVIFLWRRCIRYRMWILMEKVVAHLTAPRLIDIFHVCRKEEGERTRGIVKNWKVIPRAIIYLSFLLVFPLFYFLDNINRKEKLCSKKFIFWLVFALSIVSLLTSDWFLYLRSFPINFAKGIVTIILDFKWLSSA